MMPRAAGKRNLADLCRRMAGVPTSGGRHEDRLLLALAEQLESESGVKESNERPNEIGSVTVALSSGRPSSAQSAKAGARQP
jgi:hypothetical protein